MKRNKYIIGLITILLAFLLNAKDTEPADVYYPPPAGALSYYIEGVIAEMNGEYMEALKLFEKAAKYDQGSTEPLMSVLEIAIGFGDYEHAIKVAEEIVRRDSTNAVMKKMMVDIYIQTGLIPDAILHLEDLLRLEPDTISNYFTLAQLYMEQGDSLNAFQIVDLAEAHFPDSASKIKSIGDFYLHIYKFDKAEELFNRAIEIDSKYPTSYLGLALIYERTDRNKEAKESYETFFKLDSKPEEIFLSYLALLARDGDTDEALKQALAYIEDVPHAGMVHRRIAYIYLLNEETEKSLSHLKNAYTILQDDPAQLAFIAELYSELGKNDSSKVYWQEYLIYDESLQSRAEYYEFLLSIGDTLSWHSGFDSLRSEYPDTALFDIFEASRWFDLGEYDSSIVYLNKSLAKEPDNTAILFTLGDAYERNGQRGMAIDVFDSLLILMPDNPVFMNYLGYILADMGTELDRAEELIVRALDFEPNSGAYLDSYAWVLFKQNEYEKALETINKAIEAFDQDPIIFEHKAEILLKLGKSDEADVCFDKAIQLSEDEEYIKELKGKMSK